MLIVALILAVGGTIGYISYTRSAKMIEGATADVFARMTASTVSDLRQLTIPAVTGARLLAEQRIVLAQSLAQRLESLGLLRDALNASPALSSVYVGYDNGDMLLVRRIGNAAQAQIPNTPQDAAYLVQSIERAGSLQARGRYLYYNAALMELRADDRPDYLGYDPRERPWYTMAAHAPDVVRTDPYVFSLSANAGITLARRSRLGPATAGVDMELGALGSVLAQQKPTPHSELAVFDAQRQVIAYADSGRLPITMHNGDGAHLITLADLGVPALTHVELASAPSDASRFQVVRAEKGNGENWRVALSTLRAEGLPSLTLAQAVPEDELLAEPRQLLRHLAIATLLILLLAVVLSYGLSRGIARPLRRLAHEAEAVHHFDFYNRPDVRSYVLEVNELSSAMASMRRTIRRFMHVTSAIGAEEDFERLLPRLLTETADAAGALGGALFLADASGGALTMAACRARAEIVPLKLVSPHPLADMPQILHDALHGGHTKVVAGDLSAEEVQRCGLSMHLASGTTLAVALLNRKHKLVGAMLLWGRDGNDPAMLNFISSLSGSAVISLEARELLKAQNDLFEALIQLVAGAIDTKSPYTGRHCARVPELIKMLARAACDAVDGPYKDFRLDDDEWEAVHVAAWLHDCGKVRTPEFVVDKATKLETIHDRLHEISMRFEVLKRDAEIDCLHSIVGGQDVAQAHTTLHETLGREPDRETHRTRQSLGIQTQRTRRLVRPWRTSQSGREPRHAVGRGTLQNQRPHGADHHHAVATALPQAPAQRARAGRRTSRKDGRNGLSKTAEPRSDEPRCAQDGNRRHLRSTHCGSSPVQERQDAFRIDSHNVIYGERQHIDIELFDLLLRSGVYHHYAQRFMRPEQIDEVDVGQYLK